MNMNQLLTISQSGIKGLQTQLDITASNIANVNTVGYKQNDASFQELLHNTTTTDEVRLANQATNQSMSRGVKVVNQSVNFIQGNLVTTSSSWDMAIEGAGFFGLRDTNNQLFFTRAGDFHRDSQGTLVSRSGLRVDLTENIPQREWPIGPAAISQNGEITIQNGNQSTLVGRLNLYKPLTNEPLKSVGNTLFQAQQNQVLQQSEFDTQGFGTIRNFKLENSSVNLADSMTDLLVAQRAYSMNLKAVTTIDEMSGVINRFTE